MAGEEKEYRVNNKIRAREVRLVGVNGENMGVMSLSQALRMAEEAGLDLVEVAPNANPPVCRIMDFGKFKYERKKALAEQKKKQAGGQVKEVKIRYRTDQHDLQTKIRQTKEFLQDGHKVKISMFFKGRELQFLPLGRETMEKVASELMDVGTLERPITSEGRLLTMFVMPKTSKKPSVVQKQKEGENA